ncbi:alpha/beta hydrolase [Maribellus sp. YY47]|uniref:alpha/beta hydrolase n=1 Tax=Maribellus sp. YY47 TaxID=2929486 RepID=UPI002001045B|nr:alpha/beta hydrolase [Maribellus sp. YY47]MCK3683481.1 alpha/beta hydrolase [Maribellus sp. YY47]
MKTLGLTFILVCFLCCCSGAQTVIPLYDGAIPGEKEHENKEYDENGIYFAVSKPDLTIYLPQDENQARTAVVICPGGGYHAVCASYEGHKIAKEMNRKGVAAFVLKYRLPSDENCSNKTIAPLQDAQRALKIVRDNAEKWGINKDRIGIMGFSAGGHLASTAGTHFSKDYIENKEGTSLRPDFMLLVYPVISMQPGLTHGGSRDNLLGKNASDDLLELYSNEKQVAENTPPAFLTHAMDDDVVPVENSIRFYEAMKAKNVPADMHLFSKGKHGYPLEPAKSNWLNYVFQWMQEQELIKQ